MTLHDAGLYYDYASRNPTVRAMVAAYLDIQPAGKSGDMRELAKMAGPGGVLR